MKLLLKIILGIILTILFLISVETSPLFKRKETKEKEK